MKQCKCKKKYIYLHEENRTSGADKYLIIDKILFIPPEVLKCFDPTRIEPLQGSEHNKKKLYYKCLHQPGAVVDL
jgi:hypothetical protein